MSMITNMLPGRVRWGLIGFAIGALVVAAGFTAAVNAKIAAEQREADRNHTARMEQSQKGATDGHGIDGP